MNTPKIMLGVVIVALVGSAFYFDLTSYLSLDYFSTQRDQFQQYYLQNPWQSAIAFLLIYITATALSIPGAAALTLIAGALFGLGVGTLLVSIASTIGATLAFLVSRYLFRDSVQQRFKRYLQPINDGIKKDGGFYLFGLRLVPAFPFFVINLVMGVTPIKTWTFFWVSQVGMLPGTLVYVNAGTQLGQLEQISGILSPSLIASFVLLGLFPLLAKKIMTAIKARKVLAGYSKPKQVDTNLVVIGAGSAGLVTAYIAAATKAKVTLIERDKMGGDCLNTGCVPSKALLRSAKIMRYIERAEEYGLNTQPVTADFPAVMNRIQKTITAIEPHDSVERYTELGVDCVQGSARILDPYRVEVNGQVISTRHIAIATGAKPTVPPIPGIETIDYLTSENLWSLREQPGHLLVLGGGPIGCEMAQAFARLGSRVSLMDLAPRLLPREDDDVAKLITERLIADGIELYLNCKPAGFNADHNRPCLNYNDGNSQAATLEFDRVLVAVGRTANTEGLGLDALGIERNANGTLKVDDFLRTNIPTILGCGDVAGPYQFTHAAAHQAWYVAVNSLFGRLKKFKVDYRIMPWCTFTDPEVARVGLNEQDAREQDINYEVTYFDLGELDRAIAEGENQGFVKVLTVPGKDKILGVTIVGHHAGDLIAEYVMAMKHGLGLNKVLGTIHIYPTLAEANKYAAGAWKRNHVSPAILNGLSRFHRWMR